MIETKRNRNNQRSGRRMLSAISACFVLAAAVMLVGASDADAVEGKLPSTVIAVVPPSRTGVRESYQTAMGRYEANLQEQDQDRERTSMPRGLLIPGPQRFLWTWTNRSSRVQRVSRSVYSVGPDDCLERFCVQIFCRTATWPAFTCSDGRERRMSAPDLDTVVFDGLTYRRLQPLPMQ